jgi:hypothetical protein
VLAGCTTGGSDNPSLSQPSVPKGTSVSSGPPGPAVAIARVDGIPVPQLAGHATANSALQGIGKTLPGTCQVTTMRDDLKLASFRWTCRPGGVTTATFSLADDQRLALGDLFTGDYASYLSSTAATQLRAEGVAQPATSNLSAWSVTPYTLQIDFPSGSVAFPLSSLNSYIRKPGPLAP